MTPGVDLGRDYRWPSSPVDVAWGERFRDLERLRSFAGEMPTGPHRDFVEAFLVYRDGHIDDALRMVERLLEADPFDDLWSARLHLMHGGLLHAVGLLSPSLEARERGLVLARRAGNPNAVILALHDRGVVLERTDGKQAQEIYLQVIDLIDAVDDAPAYARAELEALRALAIVNLHLFSDRTRLALPPGVPDLAAVQEWARGAWPNLAAAIQAFRGLGVYDSGDPAGALAIFEGLPDPLTMADGDHAVIVATGVATRLMIQRRHQEALALVDEVAKIVPAQFLHEALQIKASVYVDMGDFEHAYAVEHEINGMLTRIYGDEARAAVRALEVLYRTDRHREAADAARQESATIAAQAEQWRQNSLRDPLTDAWNRRYLQRRLDELSGSAGHQLAVLDLDGFKQINDTLGHATGDDVLVHIVRVIRRACGAGDVCVRYGGDEFCVIRPAGSPGSLADDLAAVCRPGPADGAPEVTLSIGVVEVGADGFESAFDRADLAMYEAKRSGGAALHVAGAAPATPA